MARKVEIGDRTFVVIVECECEDRWWAQPEGAYFPMCQTCGTQAMPRGIGTTEGRAAAATGGVFDVVLERDAMRDPKRTV